MSEDKLNKTCPQCGGKVHPSRVDDAETQWYECEKCGRETSRPKKVPEGSQNIVSEEEKRVLSEIAYGELKSGEKGISIGTEEYFLAVKRIKRLWKFRLINIFSGWEPVTAWISLLDPEKLRTARAGKPLRDLLKDRYADNSVLALEVVIGVIQDNANQWKPEELSKVGEQLGESDQAAGRDAEARSIVEGLQKIQPDITEEMLKEWALTLLRSPGLLFQVKQIYEKGVMVDRYRFVLGEDDKKLLIFAISASAKTSWPQSLWTTGSSGFGKTNMMMVTLALMPPGYAKVRSYLTGAGLRYGSKDYKVLFIREWRQFAEQDIRLMSREDGAYTYEIAVRDPETHEWTTQVGEIPAKTVMTTSAERLPSAQMLRRCWLLSVDETPELTELVNKRKSEYRAGKVEPAGPDEIAVARYAVTLLEPAEVVVPYAELLVDLVSWDRSRLDYFLDMTSIIAWLHQYQRFRNGEGKIIATPADLYMAIRICWSTLMQSLLQLPDRLKKCWNVLPEDPTVEGKTTKEIALELSVSQSAVRNYLSDLINLNYAVSERKKGSREKLYWKVVTLLPSNASVLSTCDTLKWKEITALTERALENAPLQVSHNTQGVSRGIFVLDPLMGDNITLVSPPQLCDTSKEATEKPRSPKEADSEVLDASHDNRTVVTLPDKASSKPVSPQRKPAGEGEPAFKAENIESLLRLDQTDYGECAKCGQKTTLEFSVTLHNGDRGFLCGKCGLQLQKQVEKAE